MAYGNATWSCDGNGSPDGNSCPFRVPESGLYNDESGQVVALCKRCAAIALADGGTLNKAEF